MKDESEAQYAHQLGAVRKEWGGEFDGNLRLGNRAVREFGLEGRVEKLEAALGSGELLKRTAKLGRGFKEDAFARQTAGRSLGKSKDEAAEEIGALYQDKIFVQRYLSKDVQAVKHFTALHRIAFEKNSRLVTSGCDLALRSSSEYIPTMEYQGTVTIEPDKRSGKPCVRGLRITVRDVLEYLAGGMTPDEIVADFPELTLSDIRACLAFAADRERKLFVAA